MSAQKVIIVGNLGRDPETTYSQNGSAITKFSVATSEKWTDKQSGDKKEKTEWHRICCFGKLAEICGEYLTKGKLVYIEGRLQTSSWEKDGIKRYSTEIITSEMRMLGGRGDSGQNSGQQTQPPEGDTDIPF